MFHQIIGHSFHTVCASYEHITKHVIASMIWEVVQWLKHWPLEHEATSPITSNTCTRVMLLLSLFLKKKKKNVLGG